MYLILFVVYVANFSVIWGIILLNSQATLEYDMLDDTKIDRLESEGYKVNRISSYITVIRALRSSALKEIGNNGIDLLCYSDKEDGILIHSKILKESSLGNVFDSFCRIYYN